jgi:hypothetical protein
VLHCQNELTNAAYNEIAVIEGALADIVEQELRKGFGNDWWRLGIPPRVRADIAEARELDPDPLPDDRKLAYATLIQLDRNHR